VQDIRIGAKLRPGATEEACISDIVNNIMSTFSCPVVGCGKTSPRSQGLSAHVRNAHPEHWKKYGTKPATASETPIQSIPATTPAPTSPLEHIDAAISGLKKRQEAAHAEIERLTALQAEEADITRQLEALTQARAAFAPAETTTSATDTGVSPAPVAKLSGNGKRKSLAAAG
jgi:hypothetical protein